MNRRDLMAFGAGALASQYRPAPMAAAPPAIPGLRLFDVRKYGATGDARTLDTPAINSAIDACHASGGGIAYVPPGAYLCGTVVLKSNVTLYLEAGATLLGSTNLADYSPQPGPPLRGDANQKHLIFAHNAENVGLAGPGRIDGQGRAFWVPSGRVAPPAEDHWKDVATYDWKPTDRPSPMLEFAECRNLRIEDVQIANASGWTLRPINCDDVFIRGISIRNPIIGPNTDGIDATGCRNVFISDCSIETGDDCICLKSENPYGRDVRVSKNIVITNCVLTCCCNGLKFGTATRGGYENVTFSNSVIYNDDVDPAARVISGIAIEMVDGGWIEGVAISNIRMQRVRTPIFIRRGNRTPRADGTPGTLRGVTIDNVHATGAILTSSVTGLPGFDVEDVSLSHIRIDSEERGRQEWVDHAIPEVPKAYPEARMFGRLPCYGLYCRDVSGLRLRGIEIRAEAGEARPALVCDDVNELDLDGFRSTATGGSEPVVRLVASRAAWLRGCSSPAAGVFLAVHGASSNGILLSGSDLARAGKAVSLAPEVPEHAVKVASL
jgi:polygalacturonase